MPKLEREVPALIERLKTNNHEPTLHFVGITILGWVGWWIGESYGFVTGFILSAIGNLVDVYAG